MAIAASDSDMDAPCSVGQWQRVAHDKSPNADRNGEKSVIDAASLESLGCVTDLRMLKGAPFSGRRGPSVLSSSGTRR